MILIPKKGDLSSPSNHCGISLTSIVTKVINWMILNRIQPKVDPYLWPNQNGFRPGGSTAAHILLLRRLIEGVKEGNLRARLVFINLHLQPNQNGFRPGGSTTAHILPLRRFIEGVKEGNLRSRLVFINFKKAFGSIHRGKMLKILRTYGIPKPIVAAIGLLYIGMKAKVFSFDEETEFFEILAGILQGDTLVPYIFTIVLDYSMR